MKFGNSKVVATIVAVAVATTLAGCSKDENNSVQGDSDTEKDLLTSSSSIDIWSAQESIDSTLNSHDTSKPIEKDENPTGEASVSVDSGTSSDANSSLTDDKSDSDDGTSSNGTSDSSTNSSTGETSKSETSKPSDNTTSVPSDSSNSSLTDDKSDSDSSSDGTSESVTNEEFKAVFGYDIPEGATEINLERGTYRSGSVEKWSEAALAARDEAIRKAHEAIENGTYGKVTSDQAAELDKIFLANS